MPHQHNRHRRKRRLNRAANRLTLRTAFISGAFLLVAVVLITVFTGVFSFGSLNGEVDALCTQAEDIYRRSGVKPQNKNSGDYYSCWIDSSGSTEGGNSRTVENDFKEALSKKQSIYHPVTLDNGRSVVSGTRLIYNDNQLQGAVWYAVDSSGAVVKTVLAGVFSVSAAVILLAAVIIITRRFVNRMVAPIEDINFSASKIAQGDFNIRLKKKHDDEIGDLCDAINDMAVSLHTNEKMKNEFISAVSHELRTPLTAIKGWAETMQGGGLDDDMTSRGMSVIIHESERLQGIVEELLDFSRIQNNAMKTDMKETDILGELDEAVYMFTDRAKAENKMLLYRPPKSLPKVYGDVNRLRQVFVNLIDNALKYTDAGGTVNVSAVSIDGFVRITVADNGCGIPPEHLPNVRKKFYKANQTARGNGIGLALADEIVALHAGTMEIESRENIGTAVTVQLPDYDMLQKQKAKLHS